MSQQPRIRVAVILAQDGQILLVRHRKGDRAYWMLPGGGLDYGETFEACAIRELREETGLEIEVDRMLFLSEAICPRGTRHVVNIYLVGRVVGGAIAVPEGDIIDAVRFVPIAEFPDLTLYPPIMDHLLAAHAENFQGPIRHLGAMWAD
jgi:ADP-ribose pyrophosphatase YjhB (NUDIX family)